MGHVFRMKLDNRGRITIPREILHELGIATGDGVLLYTNENRKILAVMPEVIGSNILQRELARPPET